MIRASGGKRFDGLDREEAQRRLQQYGPNVLPSSRPKTIWHILREILREPMFLLLVACGLIYLLLGDPREGASLLVAILIIIGINFHQHRRSERALEALRDLSSPRALVIRNGERERIPGRDVVPGDVVVLSEGDRVPADGSLLATEGLMVDSSMLTGESVPVQRTAQLRAGEVPDSEAHLVHAGTLVTQGHGIALITATGADTRMGSIGKTLGGISDKPTRLQVEMKVLIRRFAMIGVALSALVVVTFYFTRGDILTALLAGLASAIAILPEEFPMVLTIFLALGAWRLSRNRVLTRKPSAIETLGSATVLCVDKTGTLTENRMSVVVVTDADGREVPLADMAMRAAIDATLGHAFLATREAPFDPMEIAIRDAHLPFAAKGGWMGAELVRDYPFSRGAMMTTRVHGRSEQQRLTVSAKGAPEAVLAICRPDEHSSQRIRQVMQGMADRGLRVIAVASAEVEATELPEHQTGFSFRLEGLIGLEDPVRPEVPEAMRLCRSAGVRVIMMTGDHPATAMAIGERIGLSEGARAMTGRDLEGMSDEDLQDAIQRTSIFARLVPEQKLRIVRALQANNEVVAMTGDGVNDAPALKAADIGVAMGRKGTDVAREAASLVITDDNFSSIVAAIRLGRRIYDNLQKAMDFILAVHMPIIGLALLPAVVPTLPLLLLPMHIVFLEMIIDPVCSMVFEGQGDEKGLMERPPRSVTARFFGRPAMAFSVLKGVLALAIVLAVYLLSTEEGHGVGEVRSIAFAALLFADLGLAITDLSRSRGVLHTLGHSTVATRAIITIALLFFVLTLSVPALRAVFSFEFAGWMHYARPVAGGVVLITLLEALRMARNRPRSDHVP